eukprot:6421730-Pyramimonas_sp.AAC.1
MLAFLHQAQAEKFTAVLPLVDVVSAFYNMIRQFAVDPPTDEEERRSIIESVPIKEWTRPALEQTMQSP